MATNQYLPFATGGGANVLAYAAYSGLAARTAGFTAGTALSVNLNSVWRQGSIGAAMLGQFVGDIGGFDALDDGSVTNLLTSFERTLQMGKLNYAAAGGTANALTATLNPAPAALTTGMAITILAASAITTAATLNLNGLGAKSIVRGDLSPTQKGDILAGQELSLTYNGTSWQINNPATGVSFQNSWIQQTNGTYSFTAPRAGFYYVKVIGAGGSGGTVSSSVFHGGCGGGGGISEGFVYLTAGQVVTATVGQGGLAVTNSSGNQGVTSSFGTLLTATGGTGGRGQGAATMQGGISGLGAGGTVNSGLGDGSAGNVFNGGTVPLSSGTGGGPGGQAGSSGGFPGRGPGGGGGGSAQSNASGAGADGLVSVTW